MPIDDFDLISAAERFSPGAGSKSLPGRRNPRNNFKTKRLLRVALPDGKQATRRTEHDYRFVVAVRVPEHGPLPEHWGVWRWTTRIDLADRAMIQAQRVQETPFLDVRILPVIDDRK